jgi:hypothetical protein
MSIRRTLTIVAASVALLGPAAACSGGGGGNPLASDLDQPAVPAPRDTSAMAPGTPPVGS